MPRYPNFCGGSYRSQSPLADAERTMNWYPELLEGPGNANKTVLYPTPGQTPFVVAPNGEIGTRALFQMNQRAFGVVGATLYECFVGKTATVRGTPGQLALDGNPGGITENGANQALVNIGGNAYLYDLLANTLTQVLTGAATMTGMIDGYFLAFDITRNQFRISKLLDGTSWDPLQFAQRSAAPDPWQAMLVNSDKTLWLIGEQTGEVWYDAGTFPFPFAPYPGVFFKYGILAPFSACVVGDNPMWLSRNADGVGMVVRASGYEPQRVSTHALETLIAQYARTSSITDAYAWAYQDQGHLFYVLTFPSAGATHVYDETTGLWSERGKWNAPLNRFDAWAPRCHMYAFGQHLVGDLATGSINTLDVTLGSEADGSEIRRLRVAPPLNVDHQRIVINNFEVYLETGVGLSSGQGAVPQVMVRFSRNAGRTWGNERMKSAGKIGEFKRRARFLRLGSAREWAVELSVSDPVPYRIIDAYLNEPAQREVAA